MDDTEKFMAAFTGFDAAHGQTIITGTRVNGKQEARTRLAVAAVAATLS